MRQMFQEQFGRLVNVTQAVPNFLEFLPAGSSKGAGLARLLAEMAIDPANVMAIRNNFV